MWEQYIWVALKWPGILETWYLTFMLVIKHFVSNVFGQCIKSNHYNLFCYDLICCRFPKKNLTHRQRNALAMTTVSFHWKVVLCMLICSDGSRGEHKVWVTIFIYFFVRDHKASKDRNLPLCLYVCIVDPCLPFLCVDFED